MPNSRIFSRALTGGTLTILALSACSRQPEPTARDQVVTSRSDGKAIPNPRRGSYAKSKPGTWGYRSPDALPDPHATKAEKRSNFQQ